MSLHLSALVAPDANDVDVVDTDLLILGGGVAGMSAAIAAGDGLEILCATKDTSHSSNTDRAQGGVAAVLSDEDSVASHRDDTLSVGAGLCDPEAVEVVVSEGPRRIRDLVDWGGDFDREGEKLLLGLEGGHSHRRVAHAHGDRTGMEIQKTLLHRFRKLAKAQLWEHAFAVDLLMEGNRCAGALLWRDDRFVAVRAGATILATGGGGQLYRETTNPPIATADGCAMALRAGLRLRDMEFVQFHPTTLYVAGSARHLITEAVRGEGGYLRDMHGERFMVNYHPDAELAPRDVVARSIVRHMAATGTSHVFLDLTHLDANYIRKRFPRLVETCRLYHLDVTREQIPIHPSAHYMMGGVAADLHGRTSLAGLYACGEVASSGLHGANRLASNSLLEGLVFGQRAGGAAAAEAARPSRPWALPGRPDFTLDGSVINAPDMLNSIKSLMWRDVGILRSGPGLDEAVKKLRSWGDYLMQCAFTTQEGWELVNVLMAAEAVASSAARRKESRGAHFRSDFPEPAPGEAVHGWHPPMEEKS